MKRENREMKSLEPLKAPSKNRIADEKGELLAPKSYSEDRKEKRRIE